MPAHIIFVYPDSCSYRVVPPHLLAGRGDSIIFHTAAPQLAIFFPPDAPFEYEPHATRGATGWAVLEISRGASQTVLVREDAQPGAYPYAVYCGDGDPRLRGFAKGGSDPEIIIYG